MLLRDRLAVGGNAILVCDKWRKALLSSSRTRNSIRIDKDGHLQGVQRERGGLRDGKRGGGRVSGGRRALGLQKEVEGKPASAKLPKSGGSPAESLVNENLPRSPRQGEGVQEHGCGETLLPSPPLPTAGALYACLLWPAYWCLPTKNHHAEEPTNTTPVSTQVHSTHSGISML